VVNRFGREGWRSLNLQLQVPEARRPYHNHYTDDSEASISLEDHLERKVEEDHLERKVEEDYLERKVEGVEGAPERWK